MRVQPNRARQELAAAGASPPDKSRTSSLTDQSAAQAVTSAPSFGNLRRLHRHNGVLYKLNPIAQKDNACGTTSLAMIFNAFRVPVTPDELDAKYRKFRKVGTSVRSMLEAAREYGLYAEAYNRSNFKEVREHLDKKHLLVVASLDTNTKKYGVSSHYVVIHGYATGPDGKPYVAVTDPGGGRHFWRKYEDLEADWKDPRYVNLNIGYSNTLIAISKHDDLAPSRLDRRVRATDQAGYAGNQLTNAYVDLKRKQFKEAARQGFKGLALGLPAVVKFALYMAWPGSTKS